MPVAATAAMSKPQKEIFESDLYGTCRADYYSQKSYIRCKAANGKWTLVVGWSNGNHWQIVKALVPHVRSGKTKEEILQERAKLIGAI